MARIYHDRNGRGNVTHVCDMDGKSFGRIKAVAYGKRYAVSLGDSKKWLSESYASFQEARAAVIQAYESTVALPARAVPYPRPFQEYFYISAFPGEEFDKKQAEMWNMCIDKIKSLNGIEE